MPWNLRARLHRLCAALPETRADRQYESLTWQEKLLTLTVAGLVGALGPKLLFGGDVGAAIAVIFALSAFWGVTALLAEDVEA
ncbi:MAG: hypothetical protein ABEJ35_04910 [Halobacteriaceae archaeon]